jgi:hypothetical protein
MKCNNCSVTVESDGHGGLVHTEVQGKKMVYGCAPGTKAKEYPVAS